MTLSSLEEVIPNEYQNDRYKLFLFPFFFVKKYFRNKGYAKIFCLDKEKNNTISLSIIPKLNWYNFSLPTPFLLQ
jgi:hypothetical protein